MRECQKRNGTIVGDEATIGDSRVWGEEKKGRAIKLST